MGRIMNDNNNNKNVIWNVASSPKFDRDHVALEYIKDSYDSEDEETSGSSSSTSTANFFPSNNNNQIGKPTTTVEEKNEINDHDDIDDWNDKNVVIWTYGNVFDWIEGYREWMMTMTRKDDVKRVGICISQGPYLALSVLLTHAYGKTMIPLDVQNEGMERWKQMDQHVQPHLYLTFGTQDTHTVQQWKCNPNTPILNLQQPTNTTTTTTVPPSLPDIKYDDTNDESNICIGCNEDNVDDRLHHLCFTSGTTGGGVPKCCMGGHNATWSYLKNKNEAHNITESSKVLLASSLAFDPCLSDILATFLAQATLVLWNRTNHSLSQTIALHSITHVLTTPTLWNTTSHNIHHPTKHHNHNHNHNQWQQSLQVVALGGEFIPSTIASSFQKTNNHHHDDDHPQKNQNQSYLHVTYGVTEACVYQTFAPYQPPSISDNDNKSSITSPNRLLGGQSVGLPIPGNEIYIITHNDNDEEEENNLQTNNITCDFLPTNQVGQVVLAGTQVQPPYIGYYHHPNNSSNKKDHHTLPNQITEDPFFQMNNKWYYKTGDLGYIHQDNKQLYLLGRINSGSNGGRQIKHLGVRIELSDIESALTTPTNTMSTVHGLSSLLFTACRVITYQRSSSSSSSTSTNNDHHGNSKNQQRLAAYLVPSSSLAKELSSHLLNTANNNNSSADNPNNNQHYHLLPTTSPLRWYLQQLCQLRVVQKCTPHDFIIIMNDQYLPTTRTGKCDDSTLRSWIQQYHEQQQQQQQQQQSAEVSINGNMFSLLENCGKTGSIVNEEITRLLHISEGSGIRIKTTDHFITSLGGDSLTALLLMRALYARHAQVQNSRHLLDNTNNSLPPFLNVCHILQLPTLEHFIHHLDQHWNCQDHQHQNASLSRIKQVDDKSDNNKAIITDKQKSSNGSILKPHGLGTGDNEYTSIYHKMLMDCISTDQTMIGCALLSLAQKLNIDESGIRDNSSKSGRKKAAPRMGKLSQNDSNTRRQLFHTNPLHLACTKGNPTIVRAIGMYGLSQWAKTPNASGTFAIHLICNNNNNKSNNYTKDNNISTNDIITTHPKEKEQEDRLECLKHMLSSSSPFHVPVTIRDASKQTLLHAAARGGHGLLLQYLLSDSDDNDNANLSRLINSHDRWFRTPLHWSILNGHYTCTKTLLEEKSCLVDPPRPSDKVAKRFTSGKIETPMDIAKRLVDEERQELVSSSLLQPKNMSISKESFEKLASVATPTSVQGKSVARDILDLLIDHSGR